MDASIRAVGARRGFDSIGIPLYPLNAPLFMSATTGLLTGKRCRESS
jgi:hypothetical protein